ncbi:Thymidylate kinase [Frankliniella fusca]|uniref:Thymidylate kinase n=1 Tax=Frankliniella fusca TaxID=407009 RepID=A0AAE1H3R3_9NEOP|nr:Thymidylate kinase [Frankliniella fusca]
MGTPLSCPGDLLLQRHRAQLWKNPKKPPLLEGSLYVCSGSVCLTGVATVLIERGGQNESTLQVSNLCDTWKGSFAPARESKIDSVLREG